MGDIEVSQGSVAVGRGTITAYDGEAITTAFGDAWSRVSRDRKLAIVRLLEPESVTDFYNTATVGQFESLIDNFDRGVNETYKASHMAVGTDNSTSPSFSNQSLNNEGYRSSLTQVRKTQSEITFTLFLDSNEANDMKSGDNVVREVGVTTGSDPSLDTTKLLNHALVDPEPKSTQTVLTIEVTFAYTAQ
jgi:hypothetical protein